MKVLIVNNLTPFIRGEADELAAHLQKNIVIAGHEAEVLRIPFQWEPARRIPSQMLMVRTFELCNVDHVIALKFPAYLIRHPRKTLWLLHQYRQAYDLFDAVQTNLPNGQLGDEAALGGGTVADADGGQRGADHRHEHDRVLDHQPRMEFAERVANGGAGDGPIKERRSFLGHKKRDTWNVKRET